VQRLPDIFAPIRGLIDQQRRKGNKVGQFLFLGSASIDLLQQSSETLAGRISYIEMFPINVLEYAKSAQHS
jgi:predicted AAA+ superfamily ATPase